MFGGTVPLQAVLTWGCHQHGLLVMLDATSLLCPRPLLERDHSLPPSPWPQWGWSKLTLSSASSVPCLRGLGPKDASPSARGLLRPGSVLVTIPPSGWAPRRELLQWLIRRQPSGTAGRMAQCEGPLGASSRSPPCSQGMGEARRGPEGGRARLRAARGATAGP